ncbi:citramalate synthase [Haloferax sp. MBLA0076]|uniref:Citramalate synthase n=1 Tax=Haloferax litoreum TaxID=2666140 RepID=A0A6A8GMK7_9EURY|nr:MULTISPECIES: citramalate synthase [Haloferax]KAB1190534.1 citramalate synthase [Haloferax sp. CBA1148]MRX23517.1 citramalate synthase [Haloferax litoreum]
MELSDVTLREGDQMPGREFTTEQKIQAVRELDDLGVPYIQPVFPVTGEKDRTVLAELAGTTDAEIIALARALSSDIELALDGGADIVEVFLSVSDRHLEHLLGKSRREMETMLVDAVDYVTDHGGIPHVTLADAFRTDVNDLVRIFELLTDPPVVTLADSVGVRTPSSTRHFLKELESNGVNLGRVGVHFHDDLGCATANALTAYEMGVAKADASIAGLGERAGNSVLEEVIAACAVDFDDSLGIHEEALVPTCRRVLETVDESYDERKAVLGSKTAEHESGIHTAAMLSDPATLEPFDPTRFGGERQLWFGAPTGTGAARWLLERAGVAADKNTVAAYLDALAERGPLNLDDALQLATHQFGES